MKKRLNFLCVLVLLVLSYSIIETIYYIGLGVNIGVSESINNADMTKLEKMSNIHVAQLQPKMDSGGILTDSVYNEKQGTYAPVMYGQMVVSVKTNPSTLSLIASIIVGFATPVVMIWALVLFFKIITAINRSSIFNWKNIRRLSRLGVLLVVGFCCNLLNSYITLCDLRAVFAVPGYSLSILDSVSITTLVLGISALIVAEIFAIGLRMQEEQDLTI